MWCSFKKQSFNWWPLFFIGGMVLWWGFSPWMLFFLFWFIVPMSKGMGWHKGWHEGWYGEDDASPEKHKHEEMEKRKNDEKAKNDDKRYIQTKDGEWLEIV